MRRFEELEQRIEKRTVCVEVTCDLCGTKAKRPDFDTDVWSGDYYGIDDVEVTVRRKVGASYGGEGNYKETAFDICPQCFETKIRPWLEQQGAKARSNNVDW